MKKVIKFSKFLLIGSLWTFVFLYVATAWMEYFWNFKLLSGEDWRKISYFWNHGGVIKQQKDVIFVCNIVLLPFLWIWLWKKLQKADYMKILLLPFEVYSRWSLGKIKNDKRIVLKNIQYSDNEAEELKAKIESIKPKGTKEKGEIKRNLSASLLGEYKKK